MAVAVFFYYFYRGDWALGCVRMHHGDFANIFLFCKFLSLNWQFVKQLV